MEFPSDTGKLKIGLYAGTSLPNMLSSKIRKNNTTGMKGVYRSGKKYIAGIKFQGKSYHLGIYETLEEAAKARKFAEYKPVSPVFEQYINEAENKGAWIKKVLVDEVTS